MTSDTLPDGWSDRHPNDIPDNATLAFGGENNAVGAFVDLIELRGDSYHLRAGVLNPDADERGPFNGSSITRVHSFTEQREAEDAGRRLMSIISANIEDGLEDPLSAAVATLQGEFEPENTDRATGHPAETALQAVPISTGPAPAIFCAASNVMLADALTGTPRITVYVQGTGEYGYSPVLWFDGTTKDIESLSDVYEEFPQFEDRFACDELVVSALIRRVRLDEVDDDGRRLSQLVLDDVAVIDKGTS